MPLPRASTGRPCFAEASRSTSCAVPRAGAECGCSERSPEQTSSCSSSRASACRPPHRAPREPGTRPTCSASKTTSDGPRADDACPGAAVCLGRAQISRRFHCERIIGSRLTGSMSPARVLGPLSPLGRPSRSSDRRVSGDGVTGAQSTSSTDGGRSSASLFPSSTDCGRSSASLFPSSTDCGRSSASPFPSSTDCGRSPASLFPSSTDCGRSSASLFPSSTDCGRSSASLFPSSTDRGRSSASLFRSATDRGCSPIVFGSVFAPGRIGRLRRRSRRRYASAIGCIFQIVNGAPAPDQERP
jgi:hypothetical protein